MNIRVTIFSFCLPQNMRVINWIGNQMKPAPKIGLGHVRNCGQLCIDCLIIAFGLVRIGNLVLNYPDKFNVELKNRNYDE
jgi:hypothetical protein